MEELSLEEIIQYIKGDILNQGKDKLIIKNISTDSRTIQKDELFIPLVGERFDGHNFIKEIVQKDIQAIIVDKTRWEEVKSNQKLPINYWVIGVKDTLKAYQDIAHHYLKSLNLIKIAITGSNGKTTTKEIIRTILTTHFKVAASEGNLNNQIGVPKTIFTINEDHEIAIIEMGSGKKGDIGSLTKIVEPDIGIITNIGVTHTEFLGGLEGVAKEKQELFSTVHLDQLAILNEDDPYLLVIAENIQGKVRSFSMTFNDHFKVIENLGLDGYLLDIEGEKCHFRLGGKHNLINLCFAILVAEELKVPKGKVVKGIESITSVKMRTEIIKGKYTIIKDCYNANPSSMKAGLDFFNSLYSDGKKISVLGDMLELGSGSDELHREVGNYFSELNIDYLLTFGKLGRKIAEGAMKNGYTEKKIYSFSEQQPLIEQLKKLLDKDDLIYFKASRGAELEKLASELEK